MMMAFIVSLGLVWQLTLCAVATATLLRRELADQYNCSLQLSFVPQCGTFQSSSFVNVNSGISLSQIKNVIPFGDSWTAMNDSNGVFPPPPAVITGKNPMAGGRASNGPTWWVGGPEAVDILMELIENRTEYIANDTGSPVHPYAVGASASYKQLYLNLNSRDDPGGAVTNLTLW